MAKAFGSPSYTATSGMPMPAFSASLCTVCTSQNSVVPCGAVDQRAPADHFAIRFEMSSEMNAPPKPKIAEKTSRAP